VLKILNSCDIFLHKNTLNPQNFQLSHLNLKFSKEIIKDIGNVTFNPTGF
jgi:hypothetical protein